ncbi:NINE protein [Clostridium sp. Ade.TY]|uniref:TM2 domain-containing protein n=1 Tax=Clostridium sp. Ade.TY TaxID=1391647 RepID=UPI0004216D37|nr:NINE protein [Clostridium sp. Ade.TY]
MYCKNCGEKIENEKAVICVKCGTKVGDCKNFCGNCGESVSSETQEVCLKCGCSLKDPFTKKLKDMANDTVNGQGKSKLAAALLAFFLGNLGIHRFYLGYTTYGIIFLVLFFLGFFTFGITTFVVFIWALIDFIRILVGNLEPVNGFYC